MLFRTRSVLIKSILPALLWICFTGCLAIDANAGGIRACSLAISASENQIPISYETRLPNNEAARESALLAEDHRKKFSTRPTPLIETQRAKMEVIRDLRLQRIKASLSDRGIDVAGFRIVRILPNKTVRGIGYALYLELENGGEVFMGDLFAQVYGERIENMSFNVQIEVPYRKLGINTLLAAIAIADNPQTEVIDSSLTDVNLATFQRGLQNGLSPVAALEKTPAMKLRKTLGYKLDVFRSSIPKTSSSPVLEVVAVREDLM